MERPKTPLEEFSDRPGMTELEWGTVSSKDSSAKEGDGVSIAGIRATRESETISKSEKKARKIDLEYRKAYMKRCEAKSASELRREIEAVVAGYESRSKQFYLAGSKNAWIVKPGGKSRGRGIKCMHKLSEIMEYTEVDNPLPNEKWIVQKYIERPLLVRGKKFDIRQWVVVTSLKPLTVWFYHGSYIRFAGSDFSLDNLDNEFVHLCNNSIQKNNEEFGGAPEGMEGWMWTSGQFVDHLRETRGSEEGTRIWNEMIVPTMKEQVVAALQASIGAERDIGSFGYGKTFEGREHSFEMYGYDFMVDEACNSWLIEVNSSPAMDHSTPVTEKLCQAVVGDMFELILDHLPAKAAADRALRDKREAAEKEAVGGLPASGNETTSQAPEGTSDTGESNGVESVSVVEVDHEKAVEMEIDHEKAVETVRGVGFRVKDWELIHRGQVPAPPPSYAGDLEIAGIKIENITKGTGKKAKASKKKASGKP